MSMSVRFTQNVVLFVTTTQVNDEGMMEVIEKQHHVGVGESYLIEDRTEHGNSVDIQFPDEGPIQGLALDVDKGSCEFLMPKREQPNQAGSPEGRGGCGGCGNK